jgi:hypothetical protein
MAAPVTNSDWLSWVARLVSAAPDPECAPAYPQPYPNDRFHCLLDELPLHLVPQSSSPFLRSLAERREGFFINPDCQFFLGDQLPHELSSHREMLSEFALQGTIAWVKDASLDTFWPFWLGPRLEHEIRMSLRANRAPFSNDGMAALASAGILIEQDSEFDRRRRQQAQITRAAELFAQRNYAPIRNLIHPFHVAALRRYYRYLIRNGKIHLGDNQSVRRYVAHNDGVARFFHLQIAATVSAIVGELVKPSYVYLASYLRGAELQKHTDRAQCEFSVTLCLDFSPEPVRETQWPIRLETPDGTTTVFQALGDGLVYRGTRVPHFRDRLEDDHTSTSIFFHYVPLNFGGSLD